MKTMKYHIIYAACVLCAMSVTGCTDKFEQYNTNPAAPTEEQMKGDNGLQCSLIKTMMYNLADGQQNNSQMLDQLLGYEVGCHIATVNSFGNSGNYYTYNPRLGWIDSPFTTIMPQIYNGFFKLKETTGGTGVAYQWAQILRIMATQHLSDIYGPVPYSKVDGGAYSVAYDDMPELYSRMFDDLDAAIAVLTDAVNTRDDVLKYLISPDYIYQGDFAKWVKFANSFKLRMAVRISKANPELARAKAEQAVAAGVLESADESAWSTYNDGMNPIYRAAYTWNNGEFRISGNVTSYLKGYNDPRLPAYATPASDGCADAGKYVGVRNGVKYDPTSLTAAHQQLSNLNVREQDPLLVMTASEVWFLRAEGALKGWNMGRTAQQCYEEGIRVSMAERGVEIGSYLTRAGTPAGYESATFPDDNCLTPPTTATNVWDEGDTSELKLEKILIQKWIACFPNGWEAWADFRRTGYPKHFPVKVNLSSTEDSGTGPVTTEGGLRRIPFPQSEYSNNRANVDAAVTMIGGSDLASVDLWWAK